MVRAGSTFVTVTVAAIIVLACLLCLAIAGKGPAETTWPLQVAGSVSYMSFGADNTLYVFSGSNVSAIGANGNIKWSVELPDYLSPYVPTFGASPLYAEDQGIFFLYVRNITGLDSASQYINPNGICGSRDLLAISSTGEILWDFRMYETVDWAIDSLTLNAMGGRVYLFNNGTETVLNQQGRVVFNVSNVLGPAAVDGSGNMYVVTSGNDSPGDHSFENYSGSTMYLLPSHTIEAYDSDGTLLWQTDTGDYIQDDTLMALFISGQPENGLTLPIYCNGTIYLLAGHKVMALDQSGKVVLSHDFGTDDIALDPDISFDPAGNLYVDVGNDTSRSYSQTYMVDARNGTVTAAGIPPDQSHYDYLGHIHLKNYLINGVCYQINYTDNIRVQPIAWSPDNITPGIRDLADLELITVTATDIAAGQTLWSFSVPTSDAQTVTVNDSNIGLIYPPNELAAIHAEGESLSNISSYSGFVDGNSTPINSVYEFSVTTGNNVTYLTINDVNFQPVVLNQSLMCYINGIYALNATGQLLWFIPAGGLIDQMTANNGTVYYTTGGGKIFSGGATGVVSGLAILATLFVFVRFLAIGAVSRARSRLERNENRNRVYGYVADHPGATLYAICRDLRMNVGTARYHVMILGLNHRIAARRTFGKYARYFASSASRDDGQQLLLSAMQRKGVERILRLLAERPGLSNREIAGELHMQESAASRYMKELTSTGLVEKRSHADGRHEYYVSSPYAETLAMTARQA